MSMTLAATLLMASRSLVSGTHIVQNETTGKHNIGNLESIVGWMVEMCPTGFRRRWHSYGGWRRCLDRRFPICRWRRNSVGGWGHWHCWWEWYQITQFLFVFHLFFIFETKMFYCYCRQLTVHSSTESTRHGPEANLSSDPDSPHLLRFFLYCLQSSPIQPAPFVSELSAACFPFYSALRPSPGTNRTNRQVRLICNFSLCLLKKTLLPEFNENSCLRAMKKDTYLLTIASTPLLYM